MKFLYKIYYWIFPEQLKKKQDSEKDKNAKLLLEYEESLKRKDVLFTCLDSACSDLYNFRQYIERVYNENAFQRRKNSRSAKTELGEYPVYSLKDYEAIKQMAIEYENLNFKIFKLEQQLRLRGIDRVLKNDS